MAFTCKRMTAATFALAILFAVCIVSFEIDFWSWGIDTHTSIKNIFAHAAPLRPEGSSKLAELIADIDLRKDGEQQYQQQLQSVQNDKSQQSVQTQPEVPAEVRDNANDSSAASPPNYAEEKASDSNPVTIGELDQRQPHQRTSSQTPASTKPAAYEGLTAPEPERKNMGSAPVEESSSSSVQTRPAPQEHTRSSSRKTRAKSFLVVFMGHSGSTAFTTELRTHTDFLIELLEPLEHGEYEFNTNKSLERARKLMDRGIARGKIPGFKIRPFHVTNKPELWSEFVKEYDTRVIWQYRENIVKQAVGEYRNKFLNDTSVIEGLMTDVEPCQKGSGQICRFEIENFRGLHALMNDFSTSDELLTETVKLLKRPEDTHIVRYEDYLYNREGTMRDAFDFLGVDYQNTESQRRKASPDKLCEMVSNFQELCDHFMLCQLWRPYLTDDRNGCRCELGSWHSFDPTFCQRDAWYQDFESSKQQR